MFSGKRLKVKSAWCVDQAFNARGDVTNPSGTAAKLLEYRGRTGGLVPLNVLPDE
ncbi:MAG: hypothetical protein VXX24_02915 [Pseudomonadota bacterium]|nr:hypothetical protein [Pseudomonadota bacterium]